MKKFILALAVMAFALCSTMGNARADYPERPITLICPWGAGGGTDAVARMIATLLKKELGQPVNVVNRTGGSGVVGHSAIAMAKPDGYTIGMPTAEINMMHWMGLTKLTNESYTPIGLVNLDTAALHVKKGGEFADYKALVNTIKSGGKKLNASGTGMGAIWHLAMAEWLVKMDLSPSVVKWVPSKGSAPALQDMLAGGIDFVCCSLPEAATLIEAGKVECIAVMRDKRFTDPAYKNIPTLKELGIDCVTGTWRGIGGPKGMPEEVTAKLEKALENVVKSQEFIDFMKNRGFGIEWKNSKDFATFMKNNDAEFGKVMKAAKLIK